MAVVACRAGIGLYNKRQRVVQDYIGVPHELPMSVGLVSTENEVRLSIER